ncbi:MAG: erythromycin esterase family protein [Betaproteobacteria bacterium]
MNRLRNAAASNHAAAPTIVRPSAAEIVHGIKQHLQPLFGHPSDYDRLLAAVGQARLILMGEASHGTREFYRERAEITQRLILEKRIDAVAVEADWPDAYRLHRYVTGRSTDVHAAHALEGFERFPAWMWRNTEVVRFADWLRNHNLSTGSQVGFFGLDLYSLFRSMAQVLVYLDRVDPQSAQRARARYACFDHVRDDGQAYGYGASLGLTRSCEAEVLEQLCEVNRLRADTEPQLSELFDAQQNARLVRNAEAYYRSMFGGRVASWNLRDSHMLETVQALQAHLGRMGRPVRLAIWAHNSHLGDASATEMGARGEWNLGQLLKQQHGQDVFSLGLSTYAGTVTAASDWDEPAQRKRVRPGLAGSWEDLFHQADTDRFILMLRGNSSLAQLTRAQRLQRAIGVIYRPETERHSHYFMTCLPAQFDAVLHIDQTHAVEPLDKGPVWVSGEVPETFPSGV